jgi:hypothetical protein
VSVRPRDVDNLRVTKSGEHLGEHVSGGPRGMQDRTQHVSAVQCNRPILSHCARGVWKEPCCQLTLSTFLINITPLSHCAGAPPGPRTGSVRRTLVSCQGRMVQGQGLAGPHVRSVSHVQQVMRHATIITERPLGFSCTPSPTSCSRQRRTLECWAGSFRHCLVAGRHAGLPEEFPQASSCSRQIAFAC